MSMAHVVLANIQTSDEKIELDVQSTDFNESHDWETIGHVIIDLKKCDYEFFPLGSWLGIPVVPPKVFQYQEEELMRVLDERYPNHHWGAWSGRVHSMVMNLMKMRKAGF